MATISEIRRPIEAQWKQYERLMEQSLRADNKLQQEVFVHERFHKLNSFNFGASATSSRVSALTLDLHEPSY